MKSFCFSFLFDVSVNREENMVGVISEILGELSKGHGVSTFEFIGSAVIAALLNYFMCVGNNQLDAVQQRLLLL